VVYRMGLQKFAVVTIVPPSLTGSKFIVLEYGSREQKSLKLPFTLKCKYGSFSKPTAVSTLESSFECSFKCVFRMDELVDAESGDKYYPSIKDVGVDLYFPQEVVDASLMTQFPCVHASNQLGLYSESRPLFEGEGAEAGSQFQQG